MRFIVGTKDYGLEIAPKKPEQDNFKWNMVVASDRDWARDKEDQRSVSGYVIFTNICANYVEIDVPEVS
jgi:hypothetical protein